MTLWIVAEHLSECLLEQANHHHTAWHGSHEDVQIPIAVGILYGHHVGVRAASAEGIVPAGRVDEIEVQIAIVIVETLLTVPTVPLPNVLSCVLS